MARAPANVEAVRFGRLPHFLPHRLIKRHGKGTLRTTRALLPKGTSLAVAGCCLIEMNAGRLPGVAVFQDFTFGTDETVSCRIEGESLTRQQSGRLLLAIQHWDMRSHVPF